jgi:hypothetical protein
MNDAENDEVGRSSCRETGVAPASSRASSLRVD